MRRTIGAGLLGLVLLAAPSAGVFADDLEGEAAPAMEQEGSHRNLILVAILAVVVIGGGIALGRRG